LPPTGFFRSLAETALCGPKNGFLAFLRLSQESNFKTVPSRPETGSQSRNLFVPFAELDTWTCLQKAQNVPRTGFFAFCVVLLLARGNGPLRAEKRPSRVSPPGASPHGLHVWNEKASFFDFFLFSCPFACPFPAVCATIAASRNPSERSRLMDNPNLEADFALLEQYLQGLTALLAKEPPLYQGRRLSPAWELWNQEKMAWEEPYRKPVMNLFRHTMQQYHIDIRLPRHSLILPAILAFTLSYDPAREKSSLSPPRFPPFLTAPLARESKALPPPPSPEPPPEPQAPPERPAEPILEAQEAQEILAVLPHLQSVIPQKHLIPNNRLANLLTSGIVDAGKVAIAVSRPRKKPPVDLICSLIYEGERLKLAGRQTFTEYDRNVYDAVTSLYVFGDPSHIMTPASVYRAMTGMGDMEGPSAQQIAAVTRSLDKIRFIRAILDCSQELRRQHVSLDGESITSGLIDTYLLNASVVQVRAGGRVIRAYKMEKTPILYAYSSALRQVYTVPASLLDIRALDPDTGQASHIRVKNTESRIQVKGYLLRRIEGMKGRNALSSRVIAFRSYDRAGKHYAGLYEIAGSPDPDRKTAARIRDYAALVLDYWKAQAYIRDYSFLKTRQQTTGIEILL